MLFDPRATKYILYATLLIWALAFFVIGMRRNDQSERESEFLNKGGADDESDDNHEEEDFDDDDDDDDEGDDDDDDEGDDENYLLGEESQTSGRVTGQRPRAASGRRGRRPREEGETR